MADKQQNRIIELQQRLKIANDALAKIQDGCRAPELIASNAIYEQMVFEPKRPLQGVVGHERRSR